MVDETNQTTQDKQTTATSGDKGGSTSKQVTLTQDEYQKLMNDVSSSRGRAEKVSSLEKETTRLTDELKAATSSIDELRNQLEQRELAAIKDDPDKMKAYTTSKEAEAKMREANTAMREAERAKVEAQALREQVVKDQFQISIGYLSQKYQIPEEKLEKAASDMGANEPAKLEILAQHISGRVVTQAANQGFRPDSGVGVSGNVTVIRGDESPSELIKKGLAERET